MKKLPEFFDEYHHQDPVTDFGNSPSLTRQEFKDECDINFLIKRYQTTGVLVDPLKVNHSRRPMFGDFSNVPDFQRAFDIVARASAAFDSLPVKVRQRFNYDPGLLCDFVRDPANRDEAIRLGLIGSNSLLKTAEAVNPEPPKSGNSEKSTE